MVYYLNKIMHSCDWFDGAKLPESFYAEHPLGSVLGRAKYGNRFFVYQGTTVGGSWDKEGNLNYPVIGDHVLMYSDSKILGKAVVGDYVVLSADCTIKDEVIPMGSVVFGKSPNLVIKQRSIEEITRMQGYVWEETDESSGSHSSKERFERTEGQKY